MATKFHRNFGHFGICGQRFVGVDLPETLDPLLLAPGSKPPAPCYFVCKNPQNLGNLAKKLLNFYSLDYQTKKKAYAYKTL